LLEEDIEVEGLSGTSAGGMNALAVMQGLLKGGRQGARDALRDYWTQMSERMKSFPVQRTPLDKATGYYGLDRSPLFHAFEQFAATFSPYQWNPLGLNSLRDFAAEFFDFGLLQASKSPKAFLSATNVLTGKLKVFSGKEIRLESLMASACLPILFPAVLVDGEYYWDGGFIGNPALFPLIYNCDSPDILIVELTPMRRPKLPTTMHEISNRLKEITFESCLVRELRAIEFITQLIDEGKIVDKSVKRLNMHIIRDESLFSELDLTSARNTEMEFMEFLFEHGRKTAEEWIGEHFDAIGVRSTISPNRRSTD
jgi:NTE family protein